MSKAYQGAYVSRGGEKLSAALEAFSYNPKGKRALDIGASTGGFTDCLLQAGAASVLALDVAYGQFAWKLRQDARVQVVERSNIRYADLPALGAPFDLVVADLSFISLCRISAQLKVAAGSQGDLLLLVKPQFEARREQVGIGGVVRDRAVQSEVLRSVERGLQRDGIAVLAWTYSPLKGPKGNIEFWLKAQVAVEVPAPQVDSALPFPEEGDCDRIECVVAKARAMLQGG